jgi:hypothetical protein
MSESLESLGLKTIGAAGIKGAEVLSGSGGQGSSDGHVVFHVESLLLRVTRDRGQVFLDLGSVHSPEHFHQFDDVEIAMGWRSVGSVLAKTEPEALEAILARLREHWDELQAQMSASQERFTRGRIERAARERGDAFADSLR